MPEEVFNLRTHVDNAMNAVIAAISVAIAFGIGTYIIAELDNASGGKLSSAVNMLNSTSSLVGTAVTFLIIGVVAAIGIGLVRYLRGTWGESVGAKPT